MSFGKIPLTYYFCCSAIGAGALVTVGPAADDCRGTNLQFDMGRGTTLRLAELGVVPVLPPIYDPTNALDAIFFTHIHNDHTDDLYPCVSAFFQFLGNGGPGTGGPNQSIDVVCAEDTANPANGVTSSCQGLVDTIGDPMIASGEVAQRNAENPARKDGGPSELANVITFSLPDRQVVWTSGDGAIAVEAAGSQHIGGHASCKVTVAGVGSVVIGGDASKSPGDTRDVSTSQSVEDLAAGADILVHSAIHPVFGPDGGSSFNPAVFARQSTSPDIGSMAERAGVGSVMLTHLIPCIGADEFAIWDVPGGALKEHDWIQSAKLDGGFGGTVVAGGDLSSLRIPKNNGGRRD